MNKTTRSAERTRTDFQLEQSDPMVEATETCFDAMIAGTSDSTPRALKSEHIAVELLRSALTIASQDSSKLSEVDLAIIAASEELTRALAKRFGEITTAGESVGKKPSRRKSPKSKKTARRKS